MQEETAKIKLSFGKDINQAQSFDDIQKIQIKYLGKKGLVSLLMKEIPKVAPEARREAGRLANVLKNEIEDIIFQKLDEYKKDDVAKKIDVSLSGRRINKRGFSHPISQVLDQICNIFFKMGFGISEGPEIENDYYNFEALNFPPNHPARDMQDTFYIKDDMVLRTHTSCMQVRTMEKSAPPIRIIAPGKVYRCDADQTHTPMFHQVEGLFVDEDVSFAHLKGVLTSFVHQFFESDDIKLNFRPSFFPFTEPSAEVDIECVMCHGKGCRTCKETGWLEILGAGMVHPNVFSHVKYDTKKFNGFAFGMGVERLAMLKYSLDDIRKFYEGSLSFLSQF